MENIRGDGRYQKCFLYRKVIYMTLERFIKAQEDSYPVALSEIKKGRKESHWMWFVFPQIKGLGFSSTAQYYAIQNQKEAEDYLAHPVLGARLLEISEVLLKLESNNASRVFGYPDDMKLRSSITLFYLVSENDIFKKVLDKFFNGELDKKTERLLYAS